MQSPQDYYKPLDAPNKDRFKGLCLGAKILQSSVKNHDTSEFHAI